MICDYGAILIDMGNVYDDVNAMPMRWPIAMTGDCMLSLMTMDDFMSH